MSLHGYLNMIFVADLLKVRMLTSIRDLNVHTGTHTSAQVGGAGGQITSGFIVLETKLLVQLIDR